MILINSYPFDALLTGDLTLENEITEKPVEDGSSRSDHIIRKPRRLDVEVLVSDTPTGDAVLTLDPSRLGLEKLPSQDAYDQLVSWRDTGELLTIEVPVARTGPPGKWATTVKRLLTNMVVQRISEPLGPERDGGARFSVSFQEFLYVTNRRLAVPVKVPRASGKANRTVAGHNLSMVQYVLWRKGAPPGAPLTFLDYRQEYVQIVYEKGRIAGSVAPDTVRYYGEGGDPTVQGGTASREIVGDERIALLKDLARDKQEKQDADRRAGLSFVDPAQSPNAGMPAGLDRSRILTSREAKRQDNASDQRDRRNAQTRTGVF